MRNPGSRADLLGLLGYCLRRNISLSELYSQLDSQSPSPGRAGPGPVRKVPSWREMPSPAPGVHEEETVKCENYELCRTMLPTWWEDCKGNCLCTNCDMLFSWQKVSNSNKTGKGKLEIRDNLECPICLNVTRGISNPRCNHTLCIDCFKDCYYDRKHERCPLCRS